MKVQKDLVTQVATYLRLNVYELIQTAYKDYYGELDEKKCNMEYERFVLDGHVERHVTDFCECIIAAM